MACTQLIVVALFVAVRGVRKVMPNGAIVSIDLESWGAENNGSEDQGFHGPRQLMNQSQIRPASAGNENSDDHSDDYDLMSEPEEKLAKAIYDSPCKRLVILMSGSDPRHLDRQKDMYDELCQHKIPKDCIVVVTYEDKVPEWLVADHHEALSPLKEKKDESNRWIFGGLVSSFVWYLYKEKRWKDKYESVSLMYTGHGSRSRLCTHPKHTKCKAFMEMIMRLREMSNNVLIIADSCHSASMFLPKHAQLLANDKYLYVSAARLDEKNWDTKSVWVEVRRLLSHFGLDLQANLIATLILIRTLSNAVKNGVEVKGLEEELENLRNDMRFGNRCDTSKLQQTLTANLPAPEAIQLKVTGATDTPLIDSLCKDGEKTLSKYSRVYLRVLETQEVFETFLKELVIIENDLLNVIHRPLVYNDSGGKFLHALLRIAASSLPKRDRPEDRVAALGFDQLVAFASTVPAMTQSGGPVFTGLLDFLREHGENTDQKTIGQMYDYLREKTGTLTECDEDNETLWLVHDPVTKKKHGVSPSNFIKSPFLVGFGTIGWDTQCSVFFPPKDPGKDGKANKTNVGCACAIM